MTKIMVCAAILGTAALSAGIILAKTKPQPLKDIIARKGFRQGFFEEYLGV